MKRRAFLSVMGAVTLPLAGCTSESDGPVGTDDGTDEPTAVPEECPITQELGVEWPDEFDASAVESFVEEYEYRYYRDAVVEFEPRSRLDSYQLNVWVSGGPTASGGGYELQVTGGGGVYHPRLLMEARESDPPDGAEVVPASEIDDAALNATLAEATEPEEAKLRIDEPGTEIDRYIDLLASVSGAFEPLSEPGDSDTLYVDVDGTTVELSVQATRLHGDYFWSAWYYVDEYVVRRASDENTDSRDGELLECRMPD